MTMLGLGEICGGYIIGSIRDRLGNRLAVISEMILLVSALSIVIFYNQSDEWSYFKAYGMCLMWGIQDSGLNCLIRCVLGFEFESKILPFSVFNFSQSLLIFVF